MKQKILFKYNELNTKSRMPISKQVVTYLEGQPDLDEEGNEIINMNFPGTDIYSFNCRIKDDELQPIGFAFMPNIQSLMNVNLSFNKITDRGVNVLIKILEFAENLRSLDLSGNQISDGGCEKLTNSIKGKSFLRTLNLNTNLIGNPGVMYLNELLFTNYALQNLDLGNNRYDWDGLIALTTTLTTVNNTLLTLNVDDPAYKIQDQDFFTHFGKMFLSNKNLQKISLRLHKLRFEGVNILTHHLKLNSSITVLDISCNQICFQGVKFIKDYLADSKTILKSLILSNNKICDQGAKIFAQGIALNKSLVHVDLTNNSICGEGLCQLAEGFAENNSVESLKLFWNNKFESQSISMWFDVLKLKDQFYPDFTIYEDEVGGIGIAYLETHIPNENYYKVK